MPFMYGWALACAIVAVLAAFLGYSGLATSIVTFAKAILIVVLVLVVVFLLLGLATDMPANDTND